MIAETTIAAAEQGIIARLQEKVDGREIDSFPDDPRNYRLRHQRGALLVCYRGADYSRPEDTAEVVQERTLAFDIHVLSRQLRGHAGAYADLDAARIALTGHRMPGFQKIVPRRERFLGHEDGIWMFSLTVETRTVAAEVDDEALDTLLRRITAASEYHTSEVISG